MTCEHCQTIEVEFYNDRIGMRCVRWRCVECGTAFAPAQDVAVHLPNIQQHHVADAFWNSWKANGETHKHGYYESTWMSLRAAFIVAQDTQEEASMEDAE